MIKNIVIQENDSNGEVLIGGCPVCGEDMYLKNYTKYFTLFNKKIFPLEKIDTFYQCDACYSSYNTSLKELVKLDDQKKELEFQYAGKLYAKALIASSTYMAIIDGELDEHEQHSLHAVIGKYSNIADELIETMDFVKNNGNKNDYVYILLRKVRDILSAESVVSLLSESVKMIMADGIMKKEELLLINAFLLESGLPKSLYKLLIDKVKNSE